MGRKRSDASRYANSRQFRGINVEHRLRTEPFGLLEGFGFGRAKVMVELPLQAELVVKPQRALEEVKPDHFESAVERVKAFGRIRAICNLYRHVELVVRSTPYVSHAAVPTLDIG